MTKTKMLAVVCTAAQLFALQAVAANLHQARELDARGSEAVWAKEFALSISYYEAAIERYPHDAVRERAGTHANAGNSYMRLKKYQEAIKHYEKSKLLFEILPNSQDKTVNLRGIFANVNNANNAIKSGVKPDPSLRDVMVDLQKLKKALENQGIVLDD